MIRCVRGFTLTELVIVLAIAGILAAVAIPLFRQPELDAGWFHEQARSTVRYAQRTAIAQRRCVFVSVSGSDLRLFYGDGACTITATPVVDLARGANVTVTAPAGVALGAAPNPFRFNGLGQPSSAAIVTVSSHTITVNAETGYVQ